MNQQIIISAATSLRPLPRHQCHRVEAVAGVYGLECRADLGALRHVLFACHLLPGTVRCACRAGEGIFLVLEVFLRDGVFRIRRVAVSDMHHPLCIWRVPYSDQHPVEQDRLLPTAAILDPLDDGCGFGLWDTAETPRVERMRHAGITFFRVMSGVIRDATVLGWREALCPAGNRPTRPDALVLASAIDACLHGQPCLEGHCLAELARAAGVELIHGISRDVSPLRAGLRPGNADTPVHLYCYTGCRGSATLRSRWFSGSAPVLDLASASVRTMTSLITPPYYFIGVADARGRLRRLAFFAVHFDLKDLVFAASALERSCAADLLTNYEIVLKPTHQSVPTAVANLHPLCGWMREMPPYLPDFLVVSPAGNTVIELAGFDVHHLEYRWHLGRKIAAHRAIRRPYRLEVREGSRYRNAPSPRNRWDDVRLSLCA